MRTNDGLYPATAEFIRNRLVDYTDQFSGARIERKASRPHEEIMSDITREELKARLDAADLKVEKVVEGLRADAAELRADIREGLSQIRTTSQTNQANADRFYAEARTVLAESRAALVEIRLAGEQNRTNVMGIGYKFLTWLFGAALALTGLYFTIKKAVTPQPTVVVTAAPVVHETPSVDKPPESKSSNK